MAKYKVGQELTYLPSRSKCKVVHVTPYHDSEDQHAMITVELSNGDTRTFAVAVQDDYLSTQPAQRPRKTLLSGLLGR